MGVRVSSHELRKKLIMQITMADADELALMAENLLGIKATFDKTEFCEWEIEPIPDLYSGSFDTELHL